MVYTIDIVDGFSHSCIITKWLYHECLPEKAVLVVCFTIEVIFMLICKFQGSVLDVINYGELTSM